MNLSRKIITTWLILCLVTVCNSSLITIENNCNYPVVTSISSTSPPLPTNNTFLTLQTGESSKLNVPSPWSGSVAGHSTVEYSEGSILPPATVAEFQLNWAIDGEVDIYDVSIVDGYNIPMSVNPQGGTKNCMATGCVGNLNKLCVDDALKVMKDGKLIGCRSPCQAFGDPQFCCTGDYATPDRCKPTPYSLFFKNACPLARSYVYDQSLTCQSANYFVTFCPLITSVMSPQMHKNPATIWTYLIYAIIITLAASVFSSGSIYLIRSCKITNNSYLKQKKNNRVPEVALAVCSSVSVSV